LAGTPATAVFADGLALVFGDAGAGGGFGAGGLSGNGRSFTYLPLIGVFIEWYLASVTWLKNCG